METLRVMIVDDHDVVRMGLKGFIDAEPDLKVVAEASSRAEAVSKARLHKPDVVIMDVRMPDGSGIDACRDLRNESPDSRVIMLTSYSDDTALFSSIMAGAAGYLLKQTSAADLVGSIRSIGAGNALLDPQVTMAVLDKIRTAHFGNKDPKLSHLTPTEDRILESIAEGFTNRQIADRVHLSEKTVKNYVSSILKKLDVSRRAEAGVYLNRARQMGTAEE
ncbi:MAG TPA: response regulator transcription factor [Actinomycetota bacterium]|nr:response regulator transcription factor [Actinomycetota bacterium]